MANHWTKHMHCTVKTGTRNWAIYYLQLVFLLVMCQLRKPDTQLSCNIRIYLSTVELHILLSRHITAVVTRKLFNTCLIYTVSQKKQDTKLLPITSLTIIRFSKKIFTSRLGSKFATNSCLNIPPHFKHVAKLPCEIWMQKNGIILIYVLQLMMNHKVI